MFALLFTAGYFITQASKEVASARRRRKEKKSSLKNQKLKKQKSKQKPIPHIIAKPTSTDNATSITTFKSRESSLDSEMDSRIN